MFSFNYLYKAFSKWWYTENDPDHHDPDYDETALLPAYRLCLKILHGSTKTNHNLASILITEVTRFT